MCSDRATIGSDRSTRTNGQSVRIVRQQEMQTVVNALKNSTSDQALTSVLKFLPHVDLRDSELSKRQRRINIHTEPC